MLDRSENRIGRIKWRTLPHMDEMSVPVLLIWERRKGEECLDERLSRTECKDQSHGGGGNQQGSKSSPKPERLAHLP